MCNNESQRRRSTRRRPRLARLLPTRFFKALADPSRIAILVRLVYLGRPVAVSEVAACCPRDLSVVSRHLAVLRDAGILAAERAGKEVRYSVRFPELIATLRSMAAGLCDCRGCFAGSAKKGRAP